MTKITVLLPVLNNELTLEKSINSILDQTFKDFTLLIIDDGSTDSSWSIIKSFADPRIKSIHHNKNQFLPKRLNEGLNLSKSEFIARADGDELSDPKRLELEYRFLCDHPDYAAVGSNFTRIDESGKLMFKSSIPESYEAIKDRIFFANPFRHGSLMFRRKVFDSIGSYNPYYRFSQDYDLMLRIARRFPVANLKESLITDIYQTNASSQKHRFRQALFALEAQVSAMKSGYPPKNWLYILKTMGYVAKSAFFIR